MSLIALTFVRSAKYILTLKSILQRKKSSIKIIAKIENQEGLENIHEITKAADIVMVARGDLGIETDLADLPNIQRRIMYASAKWGRRSIVATHLLESMIHNPTPTRAEVTDVANAIYEGADAVMLSGETSVGKYPIQCIKMLKKIAIKTEHFRTLGYEKFLQDNSDWQNIAQGARDLAAVSYTHLRAHETVLDLVCRLLLEKKKKKQELQRYLILYYHQKTHHFIHPIYQHMLSYH